MTPTARSLGDHLREWRQRRRMSQLDLALEAEISQRHLSFIESGRSTPSREMLLHLAERLGVPLRDRNPLLLAAGFAPSLPNAGWMIPPLSPRAGPSIGAERPRALPGDRHRPPLDAGCRQRRHRTTARSRCRSILAGTAGQRAAPQPASTGAGTAHHQSLGMARPSPRSAASADIRSRAIRCWKSC